MARLMTKSYTQRECMPFSTVGRFFSVHLILAIVTQWRIREEIYMEQFAGLEVKENGHKVFHLKRSYMVLNSSRNGKLNFHQAIFCVGFNISEKDHHYVYIKRNKECFVILSFYYC